MKNLILFLLVAIVAFSCKEDDAKPPFSHIEFYENHEAANWTKETAKEHLQGRWELIYVNCCIMSPNQEWVAADDDNFFLEFFGDSVKVLEENIHGQTQFWEFDQRFETALYLETAEPISNTFGTMYFSEDYLLFNGSPSDGPDSYFQKVE